MRSVYVLLVFTILKSSLALAIANGTQTASYQEVGHLLWVASHQVISTKQEDFDVWGTFSCSGTFITDDIMMTAGHCVGSAPTQLALYNPVKQTGVRAIGLFTEYVPEVLKQDPTMTGMPEMKPSYDDMAKPALNGEGAVPGCTLTPQPVPQSKTLDLAMVLFPHGTAEKVAVLNAEYQPRIGDLLDYVGFGAQGNPYVDDFVYFENMFTKPRKEAQSRLWHFNNQRLAIKNEDSKTFATLGDSGGGVFDNGKLVAVISTMQQNCETKFGTDYGIENTATLLSSKEALDFIQRGFAKLKSANP